MEQPKIGFFLRIKKAIFKFEEYEKFLAEPTRKSFSYFLKIVLAFSFIVTICLTYFLNKCIDDFSQVFKTEFPQISIKNNELNIESIDKFEYYFEDWNFQVIIDKNQVIEIATDYENSIILLKDKLILKFGEISRNLNYKDININEINNDTILESFKGKSKLILFIMFGGTLLLTNIITYAIILIVDVALLAVLGLIINILIRTSLKFTDLFKISIYAMTLPIILYLIYTVANIFFGITMEYFNLGYKAISYIYLITVLLIMKSDIIKNMQELQSRAEEQKEVRKEIKKEKEEEQEKQEERKKRRKTRKGCRESSN